MPEASVRRLVLLTDDEALSNVLRSCMRRDGIDVVRLSSAKEAVRQIESGADAVLVDLAKRGINGEAIVAMSRCAHRREIPVMIIAAQSRRELAEFGAVVHATEMLSKTEAMTTIAARIRVLICTPLKTHGETGKARLEQLEWALA